MEISEACDMDFSTKCAGKTKSSSDSIDNIVVESLKMKYLAAIIVATCIVAFVEPMTITPEMTEAFVAMAQSCQKKTGASLFDMARLMYRITISSRTGKCLMSCMMQKVYTLDSKGKFMKEGAMSIATFMTDDDPSKLKIAEEIIDDCAKIDVSDDV